MINDFDKASNNFSGTLITKKNQVINLDNISFKNMEVQKSSHENPQILEVNKLEELEKMGNFLKDGEFDSLFSLVSLRIFL